MQTLFTYAAAKSLAVAAAALFAALALRWAWLVVARERRRLGAVRFALGATLARAFTGLFGDKTNSPPRSVYVVPSVGDVDPWGGSTNAPPAVSNLSFAAIWRGSNSTDLVVAWPPDARPLYSTIYVYSATNLAEWAWSKLLAVYVGSFASNAVVAVEDSLVSTNAVAANALPAAFFGLGDAADADCDGASDADERFLHRTDPREPDTDGDGFCDGWELSHAILGYDPHVYDSTNSLSASDDIDNDGLTNLHEQKLGTDPTNPDTDGDEIRDGIEVPAAALQAQFDQLMALFQGRTRSLPPAAWFVLPVLDDCTNPLSAQNSDYATAAFYFGDPSTSHSEKYALHVTPVAGTGAGEPPEPIVLLNPLYGVCDVFLAFLPKGWRYDVTFDHVSTDSSYEGEPDPDYGLLGAAGSSAVAFDDPDSLFGISSVSNGVFEGAGKTASLTAYRVGVAVCSPDDGVWDEMDVSRVILDDEPLKLKISVRPAIPTLAEVKARFGSSFTLATSGTRPGGLNVAMGDSAAFAVTNGESEIRLAMTRAQLKNLGFLPAQDDDGVDEMAWMDIVQTPGQDYTDSEAFSALGYQFRGKATSNASQTLEATLPNSPPSESFFKAAGCEIVTAKYGGVLSAKHQIMNQADYFYFSGHGSHATGTIQGGFTPSMVSQYWNQDLDYAIIAGCAVLDVRNFRYNSLGFLYKWKHREWKGSYPGELWEESGVKCLLGYALKAPLDSDGGAAIATAFVGNMNSGKDAIVSWRDANDMPKGRNACAIDCSKTPHEFWFWDESSGVATWTKREKGAVSW